MRFAYLDPPYVGEAKRRYGCEEVDHVELIQQACERYNGWALSLHSVSLGEILRLCHTHTHTPRVGAWVKPFAIFKPNVNPGYTWEPVIFWGGRKRTRQQPTIRDWVSANVTLKRGLCGAKPERFCHWVFGMLNIDPSQDTFDDVFLGSGAVSTAYISWILDGCPTVSGPVKEPK